MSEIDEKRVIVPVIPDMPFMGQKLTSKDISRFPTNADFCDKSLSDRVSETIRLNSGILFHTIKMSVEQWNWKHYIVIHGRGEDGRVMILVIQDSFPVIHVRKPASLDEECFMASVKHTISEFKLPKQPSVVLAKRLVYFELEKTQYAKISCSNLKDYFAIIEKLTSVMNWTVADTNYTKKRFYLQCCRQNDIASAGFNSFSFLSRGNSNYRAFLQPDIEEVFEVSINDIKPFDIESVDPPRASLIMPHITDLNFDLETGSRVINKATDANREDTHCNIIGMTLRVNKKDLFRVALTTSPNSLPNDGYALVYCKNELEMFIVFANIIKKLRPAFISGYNIDDFDWRFIVVKLIKYNAVGLFFSLIDFIIRDFSWYKKNNSNNDLYQEFVGRQYMVARNIKLSAEETNCQTYYPSLLSFINFDEFNQLRRKHPSGKFSPKSLNFFLKQYGLPAKFDMDYPTMHAIYNEQCDIEAGTLALTDAHVVRITDEVTYCIFDTISALDLTDASGIFQKIFVLARQNKCTLHEPVFYAPGGIVMENLINIAFTKGYLHGNERANVNQMVGFSGGLVIHPPQRGLSKPKLTVAQRITISPEWKDVTPEEVSQIEEAHLKSIDDPIVFLTMHHPAIRGYTLELVKKMVEEGHETPTIPFDFASEYPTVMAENNLSPEQHVKPGEEEIIKAAGMELRHVDRTFGNVRIQTDFIKNDGGRMDKGIVPVAQYCLLQQRNAKKVELKKSLTVLKNMEYKDNPQSYNLQKAKCDILDMEQLECKIAMNTYYGKFGDTSNSLFNLAIVLDTTMGGQDLLRMLVDICEKRGCILQYGDTDSAYVQLPWKEYKDIIAQYYGGQISIRDYYEQIIRRAHEVGDVVEKHINSEFRKAGKPFSTVEKERVGFPKMNIRCKRYALANHVNPAASSIKEDGSSSIYMVGIAAKKAKSSSGLFQLLAKSALDELFNIYNTKSAKQIMTDIIADIFRKMRDHELDPSLFIKRSQHKPDKKNICINNFIARIIKEGRTPPRPYEKFEYAYVQRDDIAFNVYGNKADGGGSSFMELYTDIVKNKWPFNFMKYMEGEIVGELGQYMCCDPEFIVHPSDSSNEAKHKAEDATSDNGVKFVEMLCKQASASMDMKMARPVYNKIYSRLSKHTSSVLQNKHGIKSCDMKLITNTVKKETESFLLMNEKIDKEVNVKKMSIYNSLISSIVKDTKNIFKQYVVENSKLSSKQIYINALSAKHQQNITRLNVLCIKIDEFCQKYNEFIINQNSTIRDTLGLNKRVISSDDIKLAATGFNCYMLDDIHLVPPDPSIFEECDQLANNIVNYDSRLTAFDMFRNYLSNAVSEYGQGGVVIDHADIEAHFSDAIDTIKLPLDLNII